LSASEPRARRASGLLLHITSLPGEYGIGDLGPEAYRFADQLAQAGQRYWQLLPVGPTVSANSPYSTSSTFGGNPLLISPDLLHDGGLVDGEQLEEMQMLNVGRVDYPTARANKMSALRRAATRFPDRADQVTVERFEAFRAEHGPVWLDDFCLYTALRDSLPARAIPAKAEAVHDGVVDASLSHLDAEVESHRVVQFLFFEQWQALRETCRSVGVEIVGDLPLYVALDSADVWAHPDGFLLDTEGSPTVVAGVPPDYFSEAGQRWGNPIYDWRAMARSDFTWWRARVRHALSMFDVVRIDHFRGIAGYWEIPVNEATAVSGRWQPGPGAALLAALEDEIGELLLIAEDLGVITSDVDALRDEFGLPGMRVAQFGFDPGPEPPIHHPDQYPENVWAYTGTHDNDTVLGWFWQDNPDHKWELLSDGRRKLYRDTGGDVAWGLVVAVAGSRAGTVAFPVQDILGLDSEARMNVPGTVSGNWEWRLEREQLDERTLEDLLAVTTETSRT
jgi:4-alpha-glucanotransferase